MGRQRELTGKLHGLGKHSSSHTHPFVLSRLMNLVQLIVPSSSFTFVTFFSLHSFLCLPALHAQTIKYPFLILPHYTYISYGLTNAKIFITDSSISYYFPFKSQHFVRPCSVHFQGIFLFNTARLSEILS